MGPSSVAESSGNERVSPKIVELSLTNGENWLELEYPGAVYHAIAQRHQGQMIFADDGHRRLWLATSEIEPSQGRVVIKMKKSLAEQSV